MIYYLHLIFINRNIQQLLQKEKSSLNKLNKQQLSKYYEQTKNKRTTNVKDDEIRLMKQKTNQTIGDRFTSLFGVVGSYKSNQQQQFINASKKSSIESSSNNEHGNHDSSTISNYLLSNFSARSNKLLNLSSSLTNKFRSRTTTINN